MSEHSADPPSEQSSNADSPSGPSEAGGEESAPGPNADGQAGPGAASPGPHPTADPPPASRRQKLLGQFVTLGGMGLAMAVFLGLSLATAFPLWSIVAITLALMFPPVLAGMNLQSEQRQSWKSVWRLRPVNELTANERQAHDDLRFLPAFAGLSVLFLASLLGYCWGAYRIAQWLPAGDAWWLAALRLLFAAAVIGGGYWALHAALRGFGRYAKRHYSARFLELWEGTPAPAKPQSWRWALVANGQYLAGSALCVLLLTGVIDLDSPLFELGDARKLRGLARLIQWARGNPRTVTLAAWGMGAACLGYYIVQVRAAWLSRDSKT